MHELSIAMSLIDSACEEAASLGDPRVIALHLRLGPLSGVVKEALMFSFDVAVADTAITGARLVVEDMPVVIMCHVCNAEHVLESMQSLRCPVCGTPAPDVVGGRELQLFAMEIDDSTATNS